MSSSLISELLDMLSSLSPSLKSNWGFIDQPFSLNYDELMSIIRITLET